MAIFELSVVTGLIAESSAEAIAKSMGRSEAVIRVLKRLKLQNLPPADDFDAIYTYALVEYGVFKPEPILNLFRNEFVRQAFRRAFFENNPSILDREAEGLIQWNEETDQLGHIEYDPRREFASFTAVFNEIVDSTRTAVEVKQDRQLADIHHQVADIIERLSALSALDDIRSELAQLSQASQAQSPLPVAIELAQQESPAQDSASLPVVRWLHLSDFHVGKDGYGQRRLFKNILEHVAARVERGLAPDLVFITGDIANRGQPAEYDEFYNEFFLPLLDCLPAATQERIFVIPGNHDVDRTQARVVQTYDALLRVPELLDPTEKGQFERQVIFPRFKAYVATESGLLSSGEHWLYSAQGTSRQVVSIAGQQIGILSVNTAWLSYSDQDRHRLSAGKGLLEDGLEALRDCDLKIVLGHHPLNWFLDTELEPVRALFGRHSVLYLHGHMHKGRARYDEGGGYAFLDLQAGACFQERESDVWVNRFLWCELEPASRRLRVEPLQWSRAHQDWVLDGEAFPERYRDGDRWILNLPTQVAALPVHKATSSQGAKQLQLPAGWALVDSEYLRGRRVELDNDHALSYFDGRSPIWREALSPYIPRREVVDRLVNDLEKARKEGELSVTLLTGAAGEGKTTALLQCVCDLVDRNADWRVLWRFDSDALLPAEFVARLPATDTWLIVSDDAEVLARRVFEAMQNLRLAGRQRIHVLLCCRDTDWRAERAEYLPWNQYVRFSNLVVRGVSKADATEVVKAWSRYGKHGLKSLDGLQLDEAVTKLQNAAKSEANVRHEGTFFGAILEVRWGEGLESHIKNVLHKLAKRYIGKKEALGRTLMDAFAYIAAMHCINVPILSKGVLAAVLNTRLPDLKREVLGPLGEEAAIATTGQFVFTRHRAIAESAMRILSDEFMIEPDELYIDLVDAAHELYLQGAFVPQFDRWLYLSSQFFERGEHALGIRLAQLVLAKEPTNPYLVVKLAQLFREAGQPQQSLEVIHSLAGEKVQLRGYYYEWAATEGQAGNYALNASLAAIALADETSRQPPDNATASYALNGIGIAFATLYERFNDPVFIAACGAAAQLGLRIEANSQTVAWNRRNQTRALEAGVKEVPAAEALERLAAGIAAAWQQREGDLPELIAPVDVVSFRGLARLLRIPVPNVTADKN